MAYVEKKKIILLLTLQRSTIPPFPAIPYNRDISIKTSLHLINIDEIVQNSVHRKPGNRLNPGFSNNIFPVSNHGMYRYMVQIRNLLVNLPLCQGNQNLFLPFGEFILIKQISRSTQRID
jgi:hypothetical protein